MYSTGYLSISVNTFDERKQSLLLSSFGFRSFITLVYNFTGGQLLRWYRDNFAGLEKEQSRLLQKNVYDLILDGLPEDPTNLYVLPHFTTTGTPYFDTNSCGMIVGLKFQTTNKEVVKALLEGISLEMKFNLELLSNAGVEVRALRAIGGGARNEHWLQIKADVYNLPVETLNISEAACLGAALLGRKARENIEDFSSLVNSIVQVKQVYEPNPTNANRYLKNMKFINTYIQLLNNVFIKIKEK